MAVLVTGGAGYIGSHTVRLLAQQQRDVVVLDSLELGTKSRIGSVPFFEGSISDEKLIEKICKKYNIDEVIHFAAYKAVGESMEQPLRYYNNNVAGTINLVRGLLANATGKCVRRDQSGNGAFLVELRGHRNAHRQPALFQCCRCKFRCKHRRRLVNVTELGTTGDESHSWLQWSTQCFRQ